MPEFITVRESRVFIKQPGFRTKAIVVVTTLLDPVRYPKEDLADLYRQRWHNEVCQPDCTSSARLYQLAA
jgi:hypothetical protein